MTEREHQFSSQILGNTRSVWTRLVGDLPDDDVGDEHDVGTRPLVVCFDGDWYRSADRLNAPATFSRLVADGTLPPLAVAYVSHIDMQTRAQECPMHPGVPAFVADELLPWLRADAFTPRDHVAHDAAGTILCGVSYTGLLTWWVAIQRPGLAHRVICQSASFWSQDNRPLREIANPATPADPPIRWWIDVGCNETATNVNHESIGILQVDSQLAVNRHMRDALRHAGHTVTYHEFVGGHAWPGWQLTLPMALATLMRR